MILKPLLGSESCEMVLAFLCARSEGYASEIAHLFGVNVYAIQKQLDKLELGNVVTSQMVGRTRVYQFNPSYPFLGELQALVKKASAFYAPEMQEQLLMNRRRPRRKGKPL